MSKTYSRPVEVNKTSGYLRGLSGSFLAHSQVKMFDYLERVYGTVSREGTLDSSGQTKRQDPREVEAGR